jgi:hypothetical protein
VNDIILEESKTKSQIKPSQGSKKYGAVGSNPQLTQTKPTKRPLFLQERWVFIAANGS